MPGRDGQGPSGRGGRRGRDNQDSGAGRSAAGRGRQGGGRQDGGGDRKQVTSPTILPIAPEVAPLAGATPNLDTTERLKRARGRAESTSTSVLGSGGVAVKTLLGA